MMYSLIISRCVFLASSALPVLHGHKIPLPGEAGKTCFDIVAALGQEGEVCGIAASVNRSSEGAHIAK